MDNKKSDLDKTKTELISELEQLRERVKELEISAQQERNTFAAELKEKNAQMEHFIYMVSHDLKSPLITIKGFLALLEEDISAGDEEQVKSDVLRIGNAAEKLKRLLEDLLQLSRIGRIVNPPGEVAPEALMEEVVNYLGSELAERNITIEVASDMPPLFGDRPRLYEIFHNLVENAVIFMGEQPEPRIEVGYQKENGKIVYYVKDNGVGIEARYHKKIFDLFEKLERKSKGSGAGLTLVKRIIEVHEGQIRVESAGRGQGSTFYFSVPGKNR